MTRTNLDSVNNYVDAIGESYWKITLGTNDVSDATRSLSFSDAISQPGDFILELIVDPGQINGGDELKVQNKEGKDAFYGVAQRPNRSSQGNDEIDGAGAAALLQDIPINGEFLGTTTDALIQNIFSQLSTNKIVYNSTASSELSDGTGNVDIRADDEGALNLLNRIVLSHGGEWYVSYNSSNDQYEFIVQNEIRNTTNKTFTEENTREIRDAQVVDEEYDAVVVNGYGDGEDQIVGEFPARNNWPNDPKLLKYTDKTILSETEANNVAENLYNEHTNWRNIMVYPASDNELLQLGDEVTVNEPRTGINGDYRVVQRTLNIDLETGSDIEYVLSDRPIGLLDKNADVEEQTKSQTDYSQGNRNTLNESNAEISDTGTNEGTQLSFNIPQSIVEDISGKNRVAQVLLDYNVDDYKQLINASDADAVDDSTKAVKTTVNNFGDVEKNYTKSDSNATADLTSVDASGLSGETVNTVVDNMSAYEEEIGTLFISGTGTDSVSFNTNFSDKPVVTLGAEQNYTQLRIANLDSNSMTIGSIPDASGDDVRVNWMAKAPKSRSSFNADVEVPEGAVVKRNTEANFEGASLSTTFVNYSGFSLEVEITMGSVSEIVTVSNQNAATFTATVDSTEASPGDTVSMSVSPSFGESRDFSTDPGENGLTGAIFNIESTSDIVTKTPTRAENASDNVNAYVVKSDDTSFDASVNSEQAEEQLVDNSTTTFGQLDNNDLVLQKQATNATEASIFVNGTEISASPTGQKEGSEIDITDAVNVDGQNTVEVRPVGGKAYVKANVIIDHKVDGDRNA